MPVTYSFRCEDCGHAFEHGYPNVQAMLDAEPPACQKPKCAGKTRRWVAPGFQLDPRTDAAKLKFDNMYPYVSRRLPRNLKGCETNKTGQPVIMSRQHERNVHAMHGYERE